ncbi:MAG: aminotransferase class V-fold PLP-dependent enzyme [Mogibacterium sp.]|nr:aminotransferase class V-fold PLP-dependent enzyme [Mogibacterium sp.]
MEITMIGYSTSIPDFRQHIPVSAEWAYFETPSTGLVPDFVYQGTWKYIDDRYYKGGDSEWLFGGEAVGTIEMMKRSKEAIARMIHGNADDIAFGQSATQLFTLVTEGIDYAPEDNIVTVAGGWIGMRYAWEKKQAEGLEVRFVEPVGGAVTAEMLIEACDEHTRVISVNLIESTTGYRVDVDALGRWCREQGVLLCVDAVQALGALEVNVTDSKIDFLVGNDYKWMMNFCGTGFACVSPKVRSLIRHWGAGWLSDTERFNTGKLHLDLRRDAGCYEIGHQHNDGIYGLGLVAEQNNLLGAAEIEAYVLGLADCFRNRVQETEGMHLKYGFGPEGCSQIIVLQLERSCTVTEEDFLAAKVAAPMKPADENGEREIRIGIHYYNNQEDIDRFFAVVERKRLEMSSRKALGSASEIPRVIV